MAEACSRILQQKNDNYMNNYKTISISNIDINKKTYSFSFPEADSRITESIKRRGLINPVILVNDGSCLAIVSGRKRVYACLELEIKKIAAQIITSPPSSLDLFNLNLEDNLIIRKLNIIEQSIVLNKALNDFRLQKEDVIKKYLQLLNIPKHEKYLEKYIWLTTLPSETQHSLIDKNIDIELVQKIKNWPSHFYKKILPTIFSFRLGINKTGELITLLNELAIEHDMPLDTFCKDPEWIKIDSNPAIPLPQKGLHLLDLLRQKRLPVYMDFKQKLKEALDQLNLPPGISLDITELLSWEKNSLTFKIDTHTPLEVLHRSEELKELAKTNKLQELFDLLGGTFRYGHNKRHH